MASVPEERGAVGGVETIPCRSPDDVVELLSLFSLISGEVTSSC